MKTLTTLFAIASFLIIACDGSSPDAFEVEAQSLRIDTAQQSSLPFMEDHEENETCPQECPTGFLPANANIYCSVDSLYLVLGPDAGDSQGCQTCLGLPNPIDCIIEPGDL